MTTQNTTDSKAPRRLTLPELNHLVALLEAQREDGSYAGPRDQYYARTEQLIKWCDEQMKQMKQAIPEHLRRRRAAMPDYDKKLKEWLS